MEDILSSIKRIIAEDSESTLSSPRVKRSVGLSPLARPDDAQEAAEDEILELTDPVAVEPAADPVPAAAVIAPEPAPQKAKVDPAPVEAVPAKANSAEVRPAAGAAPATAEAGATLVSPTTAEASRSSLAALSALIVKPETPGSDTLEALVREMLKPMLADWLDAKLPEIVERQVAQEIARISARG